FYGLDPPGFLVLSATLLLPLPHYPADADGCRRLGRAVRDLHFNPQRHLDAADARAQRLMQERQAWLERPCPTRRERRERFRELRRLTEALRAPLAGREQELRTRWHRCEQEVQANAILGRRDYAICLYPEVELRDLCRRFL